MRVLILGGTGTISTAITAQLLAHGGTEVWHYNRGTGDVPEGVTTMIGDRRNIAAFERQMEEAGYFDCVIDMIGFTPDEAESAIRAFKGRAGQYVFCSTVDVYSKQADSYPINEGHSRHPLVSFPYAYHKAAYENRLFEAHDDSDFPVTILRPAQTYGGEASAVPSIGNPFYQMRRLREGRRIIVHGDGTSIWSACHRNDVARAFANAVGNPAAFGKAYNVTGEEWMTFDRYWHCVARALGAREPLIEHIPTDLLARMLPHTASWCAENFRYNNLFDNGEAKRELGFRFTIGWEDGIRQVIGELDRKGLIERSAELPYYDAVLASWDRYAAMMVNEINRFDIVDSGA